MDSRKFIKEAASLIEKIEEHQGLLALAQEQEDQYESLQKEVTTLLSANQNPTLPSAFRLRDVAKQAGFVIIQPVAQRLAAFENWSA